MINVFTRCIFLIIMGIIPMTVCFAVPRQNPNIIFIMADDLGYGDLAHFYYPHYLWENDKVILLSDNRAEKNQEYTHDLYTQKALAFIEENGHHPFFLYLPYTIPHFSDYPAGSPDCYIVPSDEPYSNREWSQTSKNYAAMITRLDKDVGKIMSLLKELGSIIF